MEKRVHHDSCFVFLKHIKLGQLTTLRIGHDNSGKMPRWNIDHVLVRNQLTGSVYRFPCRRWLGKGIDDDTMNFFDSDSSSQLMTTSFIDGGSQASLSTLGRSQSPSLRRVNYRKTQSTQLADDIYELLCQSINQLVKYFHDAEKKHTKTEKIIICYINGVRSIEKALPTFGKDGRFQSWRCLPCKLHLLSYWFQLLSQCSNACLIQFDDPLNNSFRKEKLNPFIINILEPVRDFDFSHLKPALLKGIADV
ncbi:unnamed protein product [Rotaria socialis]|uniref:PLAT domain-containing protein n=2 Tax=Rotaria socialis TaxID=392032 RepID=A0A820SK80_9BILA|nr:unnamed protein product [Rotaria socialis]CAF4457531.1 unnamed protein product [Rotaria socialis]